MSRYQKYKDATCIFTDWLDDLCPIEPVNTVFGVWKSVKKVVSKNVSVPPRILRAIRKSIKLRIKTRDLMPVEETDANHDYFIEVLQNSYSVLHPFLKIPTSDASDEKTAGISQTNSFSELEDQEVFPTVQLSDSEMSELCKKIDAAQKNKKTAIPDSVRFQCLCFLADFSELMDIVAVAWKGIGSDSKLLLRATAITNTCVNHVDRLWSQLTLEIPYISRFAEVLSITYQQDAIQHLQSLNPSLNRAKAVQACIRASLITERTLKDGVSEISKIASISTADANELILRIIKTSAWRYQLYFAGNEYLSGENSVLWIVEVMDKLATVFKQNTRLVAKEGYFGPRWEESEGPAKCTTHLQDFLMSDVVPSILFDALHDRRSRSYFKLLNHLMPLTALMKQYAKEKKCSPTLTFALQAVLLAVVYTPKCFRRIIVKTKLSLGQLLKQAEHYCTETLFDAPHCIENIAIIRNDLDYILNKRDLMCSPDQYDRSVFNPYMAGQALLHATFEHALEFGTSVMDGVAQTRLILHLYNALKRIEAIKDELPILEILIARMNGGSVLCRGARLPTASGAFLRTFLIGLGYPAEKASLLALKYRDSKELFSKKSTQRTAKKGVKGVELKELRAADLCSSFQVIAGDFRGVENTNGNFAQMILPIVDRAFEDRLIGINMFALGRKFFELVMIRLVEGLELTEAIDQKVRESFETTRKQTGKGKSKHSDARSEWREAEENLRVCLVTEVIQSVLAECDNVTLGPEEKLVKIGKLLVEGVKAIAKKEIEFLV